MEIITIEKYKVGGYIFDNKNVAEKLDNILSNNPNAIICPNCKGLQIVEYPSYEMVANNIDGRSSYPIAIMKRENCSKCKNGTLTKIVEEKYV